MKELYTKPEVIVDEYESVDVISTSLQPVDGVEQMDQGTENDD